MHLYWYIKHQRYLCCSMNNKALLDLLGDAGVQKEGSVICQGNKNKKKTK